MCVYSNLPYEIETNIQEKVFLIFSFHVTQFKTPTLKTHCIFLSCHHNYFSMACKLLCKSWRPEASTELFVFVLKCCHLMDLINTAAAPCLLLPFLLSGIKLMLYLHQRAQPDFPSRVTPCLAGSTSQGCQPGDDGLLSVLRAPGLTADPSCQTAL